MCWQCDNPDKTQDDYLQLLREKIDTHGWMVQYVESPTRPVAYTIGLYERGLPELLVTGLDPQPAMWLLETFVRRSLSGLKASAGERVSLPARTQVELVTVEHPDAHMDMAVGIYGPDIAAVQLVWADDRGRWPWAPGFDDGRRSQPVLGARSQNA